MANEHPDLNDATYKELLRGLTPPTHLTTLHLFLTMHFTGSFVGLSTLLLACVAAVQAAPPTSPPGQQTGGAPGNSGNAGPPPGKGPGGKKMKSVIQLISDDFG